MGGTSDVGQPTGPFDLADLHAQRRSDGQGGRNIGLHLATHDRATNDAVIQPAFTGEPLDVDLEDLENLGKRCSRSKSRHTPSQSLSNCDSTGMHY